MAQRLISAFIVAAIFAVLLFLSDISIILNIAVSILSVIALSEVLVVTKYLESKSLMLISLLFAFLIPFMPNLQISPYAFVAGIYVFSMILFVSLIFSHKTYSLEHLSVVFLMSIIIPFFFSTIINIKHMASGDFNLIFVFLCAWATDTGGFVMGNIFGRHKLTPEISSKKTIEGAIGAICAAIVTTICFGYLVDMFTADISINYLALAVYAFLGSIVAIAGDLIASLIKRNFGVKDFGKLIPGHGGIMDRFDSVLFVSPFIYICLQTFPIFCSIIE